VTCAALTTANGVWISKITSTRGRHRLTVHTWNTQAYGAHVEHAGLQCTRRTRRPTVHTWNTQAYSAHVEHTGLQCTRGTRRPTVHTWNTQAYSAHVEHTGLQRSPVKLALLVNYELVLTCTSEQIAKNSSALRTSVSTD
jgi:hypothetical protein